MKYNFDQIIDRCGTSCVKYDNLYENFACTDILPMWVADMDFRSPQVVLDAARNCCDKGIFGYTFRSDSAKQAFIDWVAVRHDWKVEMSWLSTSPGVVTALSISVRSFTKPGEKVLIMTPVYPPFYAVVKENGRELVCSPLIIQHDRYVVDWDDFESRLKNGVKLFILCNSHNPVGRVWTREELARMGELCCKYEVTILSDEIHADLALPGFKHTVMASVSPEIAARTLTAMAPSKTFNIAGMMNSVIVSSSKELLDGYNKEMLSLHLETGNIFGHVTLEAAYRYGAEWLDAMLEYLGKNTDFAVDFFKREMPRVKVLKPEGSFLLWLDFSGLGLTHDEVTERLLRRAKVGLNDGAAFGVEGVNFRRMNIGCPHSVLEEGLKRIKAAFD